MRLLIWDFDGTLGYRDGGAWSATPGYQDGGAWSAALDEVARGASPKPEVTLAAIRENSQSGFPWHAPSEPHTDIESADEWWATLTPVLAGTFERVGFPRSQSLELSSRVRQVYTDPDHWRLYDDTLTALEQLAQAGWTHVLLTNHVPELRDIVSHLKIDGYLAATFNSAETGYEKPHPQAFRLVLDRFPEATATWMIGDSMSADIRGAEAVGIPSILVHRFHGEAPHYCGTLTEVPAIVLGPRST